MCQNKCDPSLSKGEKFKATPPVWETTLPYWKAVPPYWPDGSLRIETIGQNGNDGSHYNILKKGAKFDSDKNRLELVPVEAIEGMAKVLTFGAKKYADRNWEKGIDYSLVYGAMLRHTMSWWSGEDTDPETGLSHLHHASCCIAFLQTYTERGMKEFDDRV